MYKALYRKWRPLTFDDVISQEHITDTLKNQIKNNKTAHAYLFTGSRGTGKTTCARILAKAVNCPNMRDGNPCLECEICREADDGSLTDIIEIDAASNNSVDDIRDLRDGAVYSPEKCAYKIYIIDEVHMLSPSAFNAFLKIMEEPPDYVKFILATTEIHKVPATILSRCQRYDFRRIRQEDIAKRLEYIASQENLNLTADGAAMIAKIADGGMRDAVSLLDQCAVYGENIDSKIVSDAAGIAGNEYLYSLLEAVTDSDTPKALGITGDLYDMSKDLTRLCEELIMQMRNIMLIKVSPQTAESLIICMPDELAKLKQISEKSDLTAVMQKLESLQKCRERMRNVLNKRVEFEMCLIRLCGNISETSHETIDNSEIYDKIKSLEERINQTANVQKNVRREVLTASAPVTENTPEPTVKIDIKNVREDELTPCTQWDEILQRFMKARPSMAGSLDGSYASTKGNVMIIFTPNRFFIPLLKNDKESAIALSRTVYEVLGQKFRIAGRCTTTEEEQKNMVERLINKAKNSNIETAVDNNI